MRCALESETRTNIVVFAVVVIIIFGFQISTIIQGFDSQLLLLLLVSRIIIK